MSFGEIIERELNRQWREPADEQAEDPPRMTYKEKMVRTAIRQAAGGNLNALIELINRTEGKVPDKLMANVEHTHRVVPWDDDDAPDVVYLPNNNGTDRVDSGKSLPPPDATDQTPPWQYRSPAKMEERARRLSEEAVNGYTREADGEAGS